MNNLFVKMLIILLIGLSTKTYAEKASPGSIKYKQINASITHSDRQNITEDFHKFRNPNTISILSENDIQTIRKTSRSFNIKSIDRLVSNLIKFAGIHLKSGVHISEECNFFRLSVSVRGILDRIKELNNCDEDSCTEKKLKHIVDLLKMRIEYQEKLLPKCYELGILLKN